MTLTSRSPMWVVMVQHKTSDQYLQSGKVSTRSIHRFKRYRLLKTLSKNINILSNADSDADGDADADSDAVVAAIALPVLTYRRAKNDSSSFDSEGYCCEHEFAGKSLGTTKGTCSGRISIYFKTELTDYVTVAEKIITVYYGWK